MKTGVLSPILNPAVLCVHCGREFRELVPFTTLTHLEAWATGVKTGRVNEHWLAEDEDKKYLAGYLYITERKLTFLLESFFDFKDEYCQMGMEDARGDMVQ